MTSAMGIPILRKVGDESQCLFSNFTRTLIDGYSLVANMLQHQKDVFNHSRFEKGKFYNIDNGDPVASESITNCSNSWFCVNDWTGPKFVEKKRSAKDEWEFLRSEIQIKSKSLGSLINNSVSLHLLRNKINWDARFLVLDDSCNVQHSCEGLNKAQEFLHSMKEGMILHVVQVFDDIEREEYLRLKKKFEGENR